eukprot:scaffold482_cov266-Amphora_coffeaeformis.AAC.4
MKSKADSTVPSSVLQEGEDDVWLRIIQVNDVYLLDNFARLKTLMDEHSGQAHRDLVVLAGDFLGPSLLSSLDHGKSMVHCLDALHFTHVSLGNHEPDVPLASMDRHVNESSFTWVNTNIPELDFIMQHPMKRYDVVQVTHPTKKVTKHVAILGLCTPDPSLYRPGSFGDVEIEDIIESTRKVLKQLPPDTDLVLPLTHQNLRADREFCQVFGDAQFPVVMGGHDHTVCQETVNGCCISKTGMDAIHAAVIDVRWKVTSSKEDKSNGPPPTVNIQLLDTADFAPDPWMANLVATQQQLVTELEKARLFSVSEWVKEEHDVFSTKDNRLGYSTGTTILTSMLRMGLRTDLALMNAGSVRGNKDYPSDTMFTWKDLKAEILYPTIMCWMRIPGHVLQEAIRSSRRHARASPAVAHGCFLHTCSAVEYDSHDPDQITSIGHVPFDPMRSYLTALPLNVLQGIDNHEAILNWVQSDACSSFDLDKLEDSGVPAKNVIVEVFSTLVWLQLGSFDQITDADEDGRVSRKAIRAKLYEIYGHDVADCVVDNVMSIADTDGNDNISPLGMAVAHFAANEMMSHHRGQRRRNSSMIRQTVGTVLGQEMGEDEADDIVEELSNISSRRDSLGQVDRTAIRGMLGNLRRKSLLMSQSGS